MLRPGTPKKGEGALTLPGEELLTQDPINRPCGRGPEEGGVSAIRRTLFNLGADRRGATAVEYGLICALIVVAAIGGMQQLGGGVGGMYSRLNGTMGNVMP